MKASPCCRFEPYSEPCVLRGHLRLGGVSAGGESIDIDSVSLRRNGKPWIPIMGEIHFSRCPRDSWRTELAKMKAGGITLISTYLFWIHHEESEGAIDFSGNCDIRAFVETCRDLGLEVLIRIGPWAHGECRNGGFPDWLLAKNIPLRCNDPDYLALARSWYAAIAGEVRGLFFPEGGNIVGIQLENELCDNAGHLAELKRIAVELGMIVPIYTVTGWNSAFGAQIPVDEVLPVFGGYCDAPWAGSVLPLPPSVHYRFNRMRNDSAIGADLRREASGDGWQLPYERYPFATCELGGGLQSTHHRRYRVRGIDIYALALVKLGCGNNLPGYYMYHGGTNPLGKHSTMQESKATGYPNDVPMLSYDFQAPISEYGEIRPSYRMLHLLHLFLQDFQEVFAPTVARDAILPDGLPEGAPLRCGLRSDGRSGFVFVNHHQRLEKLADLHGIRLEADGVAFPPIDICGETAFFLPYRFDIGGGVRLRYALAQPICREGKTVFFLRIPGIAPEFCLEDGTRLRPTADEETLCAGDRQIVLLDWDDALGLRRLEERLYLAKDCNLYWSGTEVCAVEAGEFAIARWDGNAFVPQRIGHAFNAPRCRIAPLAQAPFDAPYAEELRLGGDRVPRWFEVAVEGGEGFVEFAEPCDTAQLFADGELVADEFYCGFPWRVPAALLNGKKCFLVMSPPVEGIYRE